MFADIYNVLVFNGDKRIDESSLEESNLKSQYKADDGKLHEQERDVMKYWEEENVRLAICGIENQDIFNAIKFSKKPYVLKEWK